ncbi:BglII/BstYI family type II restriction endonuclease [Cytobacillus oceanisediminis]|uniref:BglII/BstYI family type II restriction endonuclease n=1 Tax=Cytobacillus oceanisediminis TaxID=665099 RepID=UPI00207A547F|nr:BglII/BstYI family type II restriction endonuclease [Cytobacillus oceanisediminis]USK45513.1 hypothetical protein LIT27_06600 [Cytobacillus oceanisediminis]
MKKTPSKSPMMNYEEAKEWISRIDGNLIISEENQIFFRHADLFLMNFEETSENILKALQMPLSGLKLSAKKKETKDTAPLPMYFRRLAADKLNISLKKNLRDNIQDLKFEVEFKEGVFFDSPQIGGFDFALFDETYNLMNFRNYCFGRKSIYNGEERWKEELSKREDWLKLSNFHDLESYPKGIDIPYNKKVPTIIGEVQFGNWALVYYDLLKTIQIEQTFDIDLFVYITAAGNLSKYISAGTVNFDRTRDALEEFKNITKFPIWVIGVDFE